jgi:hypothetical protein
LECRERQRRAGPGTEEPALNLRAAILFPKDAPFSSHYGDLGHNTLSNGFRSTRPELPAERFDGISGDEVSPWLSGRLKARLQAAKAFFDGDDRSIIKFTARRVDFKPVGRAEFLSQETGEPRFALEWQEIVGQL